MVEGLVGRDAGNDMIDHGRHIIEDGPGRYPYYANTFSRQPDIARPILFRLIATLMRLAIDLNCQLRARAKEVEHIAAGRMLGAKFETTRSPAKGRPQDDLGQGHLLAETAGSTDGLGRPGQHFP